MFFDTKKVKGKDGEIEVTADNHGVAIEDGKNWVYLWWKEWDSVKKTVEELKHKHKGKLKDLNI